MVYDLKYIVLNYIHIILLRSFNNFIYCYHFFFKSELINIYFFYLNLFFIKYFVKLFYFFSRFQVFFSTENILYFISFFLTWLFHFCFLPIELLSWTFCVSIFIFQALTCNIIFMISDSIQTASKNI